MYSHCYSIRNISRFHGSLHKRIRCLLQFGKQDLLLDNPRGILALKAAMWTQALSFDRHRPKRCGVRYTAEHRGHVPSTFAPFYDLTVS